MHSLLELLSSAKVFSKMKKRYALPNKTKQGEILLRETLGLREPF